MSISVSTFGQSNYLTSQMLQLEANYNNTSIQESSGLQAQNFSGIAPNVQQVLNLESQYNNIAAQTANATAAYSKANTISNALSNANDVITQAITTVSAAIGDASTTSVAPSEQAALQAQLSDLVNALNTQYAGSYVFGGSNTATQPVNVNAAGYTGLDTVTPNTSYYQGDDSVTSVQVDDSLTISYGVTADNSSFEQALRALTLAVANPSDTTTLQQAYGLLQQASSGVANLTGIATAKAGLINTHVTINQATLNYLNNNISDITNADTTQVAAQLSTLQTQLSASYSVLAKFASLSLTNYIK